MNEDRDRVVASRRSGPDSLLILLMVAILAVALSHLAPKGRFQLVDGPDGEQRIDPTSFEYVDGAPGAPLWGSEDGPGFLNFLFEGLVSGDRYGATVGLMAFILIVGGAFGVINRTGAIERAIRVGLARGNVGPAYVALLFIMFSLAGAIFGMSEEAIVFTLIVVPALIRAGYDSITGMACCYGATQIGFATSWMNPFNVVVAQGIAGIPILSGAGLRVALWLAFTLLGAASIYLYALRLRQAPARSRAFASDQVWRAEQQPASDRDDVLSVADIAILTVLGLGIVWVGWGVAVHSYYLAEISAQFFAIALVCGTIGRFAVGETDANQLVGAFRDGAVALAPAAIIVAAAKGIVILLGGDGATDPSILNSFLHLMSRLTAVLPQWLTAWVMLIFQSGLNFLIASGSGQAALTMPLMAPLADLGGVSRQTAVLAFQLGDGLTNLVVPSSAALMGCLSAARLGWGIWLAAIWKPLVLLIGLASLCVIGASLGGYQ